MPIGTAAAIAIGLGSAGATAASNIYGQRSASKTNERAIDAQRVAEAEAARIENARLQEERAAHERSLAAAEKGRQEGLAFDRERWNSYMGAQRDYLNSPLFANLLDLARGGGARGVGGGAQPRAVAPTTPAGQDIGTAGAPLLPPGSAGSGSREETLLDFANTIRPTSRYRPRPAATLVTPPQSSGGTTLMDLANLYSFAGSGSTAPRVRP